MSYSNYLKSLLFITLIVVNIHAYREFPHEHSIEIIDGEEYVQTPFGLMLKECVQNVPSGTHVQEKEGGVLHLSNDQENFTRTIPKNDKCVKRNPTTKLGQWIDNGGWWLPNGLTLSKFESNYRVPNTPLTTSEQYLYYFIGSQNNDGSGPGLSIIQPVLAYHNGWYFQSWNCCPQGLAQNTEPVYNISPYDIIYGSVEVSNNVATIISQNKLGEQSLLKVDQAQRNFNWIDATLEVYNINQCSNFPTDYLEYSNMKVTLSNGSTVSPIWNNDYGISECNGQTTIIDPQTIRIQHNSPTAESQ